MPATGTADAARPDAKPFTEPWQAQVFALTVHLNEQGLFTWPEWAGVFSVELHRPDAADDGSDYYHRWAAALETLLASKQVAGTTDVDGLAESWTRAANATPHGQPIELSNDPLLDDQG